ncbi:MAG: transcriptional repressor NrdR [Lentisphaeria bacterium]|nr:transcriptional repressor NrdR [Lentisphaeria bacterium]
MRCPFCDANDDKVVESRNVKEGYVVRRRRECLSCKKRFTTYEEVLRTDIFVIKNDGRREEFNPANIRRGMELACWKRNILAEDLDRMQQEVVQSLTEKFEQEVPSSRVGAEVMQVLRRNDEVAYIRFASIYRKFSDLEEFISEVKKEVSTSQS